MEIPLDDPADFSIWAKVLPGKSGDFRRWMAAQKSIPELAVHHLHGSALKTGELMQIFSGLGWEEVPKHMESLPNFIDQGSTTLSETDLKPSPSVPFCPQHRLFHRGNSCPICTNNYIKGGVRITKY